jgi:hypothetical protein
MQYAKGLDPAMALYAAYAYHRLNRGDRLVEMQKFLFDDLWLTFFDLALLTRDALTIPNVPVFPFVPMLAQGWALLGAYGVTLPRKVEMARSHIRRSLWTLFDADGVRLIRDAMQAGEVR